MDPREEQKTGGGAETLTDEEIRTTAGSPMREVGHDADDTDTDADDGDADGDDPAL